MPNPNSIVEIYREVGFKSFIYKSLDHFGGKLKRNVARPVENMYWDLIGTQQFQIRGTTANFDATDRHGGDVVRGHYKSEHRILETFVSNLRPDDIVYDVGGHLGLYTCFAANALVGGKVITFEPFPPNLVHLLDNIARNDESKVRVLGAALAETDRLIPIRSPTMTENYGSPAIGNNDVGSLVMPAFSGDRLVETGAVPAPSVVKIDVEGAEGLVIDGLSDSLSSDNCRRLYCEIHPVAAHRTDVSDYNDTVSGVLNRISNLGFQIEEKYERGSDIHVIGEK